MLLVGALFGLLGEQTAAAASAVPVVVSVQVTTMSADCMEMMGADKSAPAKKPCTGLTLDCIFAMACAVPLMPEPAVPFAQALSPTSPLFWTKTAVLAGTDLVPEPHPPSTFG